MKPVMLKNCRLQTMQTVQTTQGNFFNLLIIFQFLLPWFAEGVFTHTFLLFAMPIQLRTPVTRTLKGKEKQFELSGSIEYSICHVSI